jgi:hypothetical protein
MKENRKMPAGQYDVFISFKNLDENGKPTQDSVLAKEVYEYLASRGLRVFFSNASLEKLGVSSYKKAIDDALDESRILVAVGTSRESLDSQWVRYEWDSFFSDILSNVKPDGRVFTYAEAIDIRSLPRALRQSQTFQRSQDSLERLYNFISSALGAPVHAAPLFPKTSRVEPDSGADVATGDIYLASASHDEEYARRLCEALKRHAITCFLTEERIDPGHGDYIEQILRMINAASTMIVLVSNDAIQSGFFVGEVKRAFDLQKRIVPVYIEDTDLSSTTLQFYIQSGQGLNAWKMSVDEVAKQLASTLSPPSVSS